MNNLIHRIGNWIKDVDPETYVSDKQRIAELEAREIGYIQSLRTLEEQLTQTQRLYTERDEFAQSLVQDVKRLREALKYDVQLIDGALEGEE